MTCPVFLAICFRSAVLVVFIQQEKSLNRFGESLGYTFAMGVLIELFSLTDGFQ